MNGKHINWYLIEYYCSRYSYTELKMKHTASLFDLFHYLFIYLLFIYLSFLFIVS